jgi:hypothetical protein
MAAEIALPYRTDWRELRSVLDYCKGKGADRGALEARFGAGESLRETLNALEQLGLVERGDIGDVRLTVAGEQLAYAPDVPRQQARLLEALTAYSPYRFPLERAVADAMDVLDAPWVEHIWQVDMRLGQPRNRVEEARTLFFRLADEAGLGVYRRGVRGQTTRLELAADFGDRLRTLLERPATPVARGPVVTEEPVAPRTQPLSMSTGVAAPPAGAQREAPRSEVSPMPVAVSAAAPLHDLPRSLPAAGAALGPAVPGTGVALAVHVDMSEWDLDKIEAFLRLLGLLAE